jgi:hypothetical protein
MRISPYVFAIAVLVVFLGTIFGFQASGFWSVSGKVTGGGEAIQPSADDVNTIKGWMTLEQITSTYHVPLEEILTQFNLRPDTPPSTPIKDLESKEFSVSNLREWLQNWGAPKPTATYSSNTQLPTAIPTIEPMVSAVTLLPIEHMETEQTITGKTTFQDVLDWGVKPELIEQIIGSDLPPTDTVIREYVTQQGMQFSSVKTALQNEIDKIK